MSSDNGGKYVRPRPSRPNARTPTRWTPEKKAQFLEALSTGISVAGAARRAGFAHSTIYEKIHDDPEFAKEVASARESGSDRMEDALLSLGVTGKNVTALIFLLKGRRPEIYRERAVHDLTNSDGSLAGLFAEAMSESVSTAHANRHNGNGHDRDASSD